MRNPRACNPGGNSPHTVFNKMGLVAAEGRAMSGVLDSVILPLRCPHLLVHARALERRARYAAENAQLLQLPQGEGSARAKVPPIQPTISPALSPFLMP